MSLIGIAALVVPEFGERAGGEAPPDAFAELD